SSRAGYGYVARKVPSTIGGLQQWSPQTGTNCSSSNHVACVNDYDTGSFVYNSSSTGNLVQKNAASKTEQFSATTPTLVLPSGATVTAVEGVVFGNTTTGNGLRDMSQALLFGSLSTPFASANTTVLASGNATTPRLWHRLITTASPVTGSTLQSL